MKIDSSYNKTSYSKIAFNAKITLPKMKGNLSGDILKKFSTATAATGTALIAINSDKNILSKEDIIKEVESCQNIDKSFNLKKLAKTFNKISIKEGKEESDKFILDLISKYGNWNEITEKYPLFSDFFANSIIYDTYTDENKEDLETEDEKKFFSYMNHCENYLNTGYKLEDKYNLSELYNKAAVIELLQEGDYFETFPKDFVEEIIEKFMELFKSKDSEKTNRQTFLYVITKLPYTKIKEIFENDEFNKEKSDIFMELSKNIIAHNFYYLAQKGNDTDINNLAKISLKLAAMKMFYPENYDILINSEVFDSIKKGFTHYAILDKVKCEDKANDKFLKEKIAEHEKQLVKNIYKNQKIQEMNISSWTFACFKFNEKELEEILENIEKCNDTETMKNLLENLDNFYIADINKDVVKDLILKTCEKPQVIKNLVETCNYNPEIIQSALKKMDSDFGNYVLEQILLKNKDKKHLLQMIENSTENNAELLLKYLDKEEKNENELWKILVLKNLENLKNSNRTEIFNQFDKYTIMADKSFEHNQNVDSYINNLEKCAGLFDLKLNCPEKYERIKDAGFFELIRKKVINKKALNLLNKNSDLNQNVYNDLEKLQKEESIIKEFKAGTSIDSILSQTEHGDVVEVDNKLYINDGENLIEWEMTKETYLDLFPPVERFTTIQASGLGNCYFVSSLATIMNNPKTRVELYKSFKQVGNDIHVTIKAYEEYGGTTIFKNGEFPWTKSNKFHLVGCKGLKMLEYAYAKSTLRDFGEGEMLYVKPDSMDDDIMKRIEAGKQHYAMSEVLGINFEEDYKKDVLNDEKISYFIDDDCEFTDFDKTLDSLLTKFNNDPNRILQFGTIKRNESSEWEMGEFYNLSPQHAHSIIGYDAKNKIVKVVNPHNYSVVSEIPLGILAKFIGRLNITNL